jgi:hypothetical protein
MGALVGTLRVFAILSIFIMGMLGIAGALSELGTRPDGQSIDY